MCFEWCWERVRERGLWPCPWKHGSPSSQGGETGWGEAYAALSGRCCTQQGPGKWGHGGEPPHSASPLYWPQALTFAVVSLRWVGVPETQRNQGMWHGDLRDQWEAGLPTPPPPRQLPGTTWKTLEGGWWHPLPLLSGQQDIPHSRSPRARDISLFTLWVPMDFLEKKSTCLLQSLDP